MSENINVWWVQCKPFEKEKLYSDEARCFQRKCIENRFFGIGWNREQITKVYAGQTICSELVKLFKEEKPTSKSFSRAQNIFLQMEIGDVVFSRLDGEYYVGIIEKRPYVTIDYPDLLTWQSDVKEWVKIGGLIDLPHHVRGQISSTNFQTTVTKVEGFSRITLLFLAGLRSKERINISVNDFYSAMNDEDLEDLMGYYMSVTEPEYVLLPSSCKKNTPGIEYVMYNPKDGSEIACQTKVNNEINVDHYLNKSYERFKRVFLFSGKGYTGDEKITDNGNIKIVGKKELYDALRTNERMLRIIEEFFICTDEPLKEEEKPIPRDVYGFVQKWIEDKKDDSHVDGKKCDGKFIRYTTETTSLIFPEAERPLSGWGTNTHYFYEIIFFKKNKKIVFQLAFSLQNIPDELFEKFNRVNQKLLGRKITRRSKWVVPVLLEPIQYSNMTLDSLIDNLENRYFQLREFEKQLKDK